jgi:uncharacterized membrane protein
VSYRTSDRLHVVMGTLFLLLGVIAGAIAGGSWWYWSTLRQPEGDVAMFWVSVIVTISAAALGVLGTWVLVDVVRVRREERRLSQSG